MRQIESRELIWKVECSLACSSFLRTEKKKCVVLNIPFHWLDMISEVEAYTAMNLSICLRFLITRQVKDMMKTLLSNCNPDGR